MPKTIATKQLVASRSYLFSQKNKNFNVVVLSPEGARLTYSNLAPENSHERSQKSFGILKKGALGTVKKIENGVGVG